jgi:hypothetical protein
MEMLPLTIHARRRIVPGRHKLPSRFTLIGVPKQAKQTAVCGARIRLEGMGK